MAVAVGSLENVGCHGGRWCSCGGPPWWRGGAPMVAGSARASCRPRWISHPWQIQPWLRAHPCRERRWPRGRAARRRSARSHARFSAVHGRHTCESSTHLPLPGAPAAGDMGGALRRLPCGRGVPRPRRCRSPLPHQAPQHLPPSSSPRTPSPSSTGPHDMGPARHGASWPSKWGSERKLSHDWTDARRKAVGVGADTDSSSVTSDEDRVSDGRWGERQPVLSQAWLQKNDHPFRFSRAWLEGGWWLHIAWLQTSNWEPNNLKVTCWSLVGS
jgi:hypothetical protein